MKCPSCGHEVAVEDEVCARCGAALAQGEATVVLDDRLDAEYTEVIRGRESEFEATVDVDAASLASGDEFDATIDVGAESLAEGSGSAAAAISVTKGISFAGKAGPLTVGASFGDRYRIDKLLGFGGLACTSPKIYMSRS